MAIEITRHYESRGCFLQDNLEKALDIAAKRYIPVNEKAEIYLVDSQMDSNKKFGEIFGAHQSPSMVFYGEDCPILLLIQDLFNRYEFIHEQGLSSLLRDVGLLYTWNPEVTAQIREEMMTVLGISPENSYLKSGLTLLSTLTSEEGVISAGLEKGLFYMLKKEVVHLKNKRYYEEGHVKNILSFLASCRLIENRSPNEVLVSEIKEKSHDFGINFSNHFVGDQSKFDMFYKFMMWAIEHGAYSAPDKIKEYKKQD